MPQAQWIFRKDFLRLWGVLAVAIPLEVLARWVDSSPEAVQVQFITGFFRGLAQWFLVVSVIHEEAVPGDRQYWLTRPIAWQDLLLAKAAFVLIFIHLPCFLTDVVTLAAHGQSIIRFFPSLLTCQFSILALDVLLPAAIAAVTATLARFVWLCLALLVGFGLLVSVSSSYAPYGMNWGGVEWFRSTIVAALLVAIGVTVLLMQYARRDTRMSRCILVAIPLVLALSFWMPGWHAAFAVQARIGPRRTDASATRLSFDPARDPRTRPKTGVSWRPHTKSIYIPIRITEFPAGMMLYSDRAAVTVTSSDGWTWTSGWDPSHKLVRVTDLTSGRLPEEQFLMAGDECWQYLNIDSSTYAASRKPVRMRIKWAMTLFSQPEITSMASGQWPRSVPGGGSCWTWKNASVPSSCFWPGQAPQVNYVRVRAILNGAVTDFPLSLPSVPPGNYGPYPDGGNIWQTATLGLYNPSPQPPSEISLWSHRAVAHFERDLNIPIDDSTWQRFVP
jgi:YD repeat-containing protein